MLTFQFSLGIELCMQIRHLNSRKELTSYYIENYFGPVIVQSEESPQLSV